MERYNFEDLCEIIEKLRSPGGCPWDREQTHESLKKHMIEEAYEAADTFDKGDGMKMADELGDVLLQVVLHSQIGKEAGEFAIEDVTTLICQKMIDRHPHIFGSAKAENSDEVLSNWEEIKKKERGQKKASEAMEGVCKALPALMRAEKIYKKAKKAGMGEIPNDGSIGYEIFTLAVKAEENGLDPEEELGKYLEYFIKIFKKFEETP